MEEEADKLINSGELKEQVIEAIKQHNIVYIDNIDKIYKSVKIKILV